MDVKSVGVHLYLVQLSRIQFRRSKDRIASWANSDFSGRMLQAALPAQENEELLARNRELALSMQHFKQENDQLQIGNRRIGRTQRV